MVREGVRNIKFGVARDARPMRLHCRKAGVPSQNPRRSHGGDVFPLWGGQAWRRDNMRHKNRQA